jgi:transglutaminase-like putative cysteine protease
MAKALGDGDQSEPYASADGYDCDKVAYQVGATNAMTTAEEALELGQGVCQDHAHIFCAVARLAGLPARYVSGYLMKDGDQAAALMPGRRHIDGLGWVGFDPSNRMSPDETYVSVATGSDYRYAAPCLASASAMPWNRLRFT